VTPIEAKDFADKVYEASKGAFSAVIGANPNQSFYAFALWTDDSLQFLYPAANTEEALTATVRRYRETVDPKYGCTSTQAGMRWSYGDWGFFPAEVGEKYFEDINEALRVNIESTEEEFKAGIELLWPAILSGFQRLELERFFGSGPERSKITLLLVGDLDGELVNSWVSALNPPKIVDRYINWNSDAPDDEG
jgi:hypothetical protein